MPLDLRALNRGYGECTVLFNDETVTLRFRADLKLSQALRIQDAVVRPLGPDGQPQPPDLRGMMEILLETLMPGGAEVPEAVRGWDITSGGEPVPVTFDEMTELPMELLNAMMRAVFEEINNPNRRRLSRGGSPPGASSQETKSPITTDSSPTPNGQASLPGPLPATPIPVGSGSAGESGFGV